MIEEVADFFPERKLWLLLLFLVDGVAFGDDALLETDQLNAFLLNLLGVFLFFPALPFRTDGTNACLLLSLPLRLFFVYLPNRLQNRLALFLFGVVCIVCGGDVFFFFLHSMTSVSKKGNRADATFPSIPIPPCCFVW